MLICMLMAIYLVISRASLLNIRLLMMTGVLVFTGDSCLNYSV